MKIDPRKAEYRDNHKLFLSAVAPRPVVMVSTIGENGTYNVAPFSGFGSVGFKPPLVHVHFGRSRDGRKRDTLLNIEFAKEFVVNIVNEAIAEAMNRTSATYPYGTDEFKEAGLTPAKADIVKAPLVAESPVNMECRLLSMEEYGEFPHITTVVIGEVALMHVRDDCYDDGEVLASRVMPIGALWGNRYCRITDTFEMKRPPAPPA